MTVPNFPVWATNENYSAAADAYDGTPTKVDPSALSADGFRPGLPTSAQHMNHLIGAFGEAYAAWLIENLFGSFQAIGIPASETQELGASLVWHEENGSPARPWIAPCRLADYGASGADVKEWRVGVRPVAEFGSSDLIPSGDTTLQASDSAQVSSTQVALVQSAASTSGTCLSVFEGGSSPWTHRDDSILDGAGADRIHADGAGGVYIWRTTDSKFFTNDSANLTSCTFTQGNSAISHKLMASRPGTSTLVAANPSSGTIDTERIDTPSSVVTSGTNLINAHGLVVVDDEYVLICSGGALTDEMVVRVSDDNGATWTDRFRGADFPLGTVFSDRQRAFVVEDWLLVYGETQIFASRDGGRSWTRGSHNLVMLPTSGKFQLVNGKVYYSDLYTCAVSVGTLSA